MASCIFPSAPVESVDGVNVPVVLIGDSAYPLLSCLMKPFPETRHMAADKRLFNFKLSSARMIVENTSAQLKGRWRCLSKCLEDDIRNVSITIGACCVLHNFCIMRGDHFDRQSWAGDQVVDDGDGGIDVEPAAAYGRNSVAVQNAIATLLGNL